ncbi:MAG TPA: peptidoglycan DD-metalloendopeptidase family protein, partial [Acidimicrobiales bacterium]
MPHRAGGGPGRRRLRAVPHRSRSRSLFAGGASLVVILSGATALGVVAPPTIAPLAALLPPVNSSSLTVPPGPSIPITIPGTPPTTQPRHNPPPSSPPPSQPAPAPSGPGSTVPGGSQPSSPRLAAPSGGAPLTTPLGTGEAAPPQAGPVVPALKGPAPVGKGMWIWAPPRQTGPSDTAVRTPSDFSRALLAALGEPNTGANVQALDAWQEAEGGFVHLNPLNTTQPAQGSTTWNSVGVKSYPDWKTAIRATAQTMRNGQYRDILAALKGGNNAGAVARAVAASPWGTGDFSRFIGQRYVVATDGGDVSAINAMVTRAQAAGLSYVVVLLGSSQGTFDQQSFLDAFLPSAHAANIRVYGADVPSLTNAQADVARALSEITYTTPDQDRIDGIVADLEPGTNGTLNTAAAQTYGSSLRTAVGPDLPLVAAIPASPVVTPAAPSGPLPPVPASPSAPPAYPSAQVVAPFDAVAVMDPSTGPGHTDLGSAMTALASLGKPLVPVDQTPTASPPPAPGAPDPARDQVLGFINAADSMKATSVAFWSWETASQSVFDALQAAPQFSLPAVPAPMTPNQVRGWQALLSGLGFPAPASGQWDAPTTAAVKAYQQAAATPPTGTIDDATRTNLLTPFPPPIPADLLAGSLAVPGGVVGPGGAGLPLPRQYLKNGSVDQGVDYSAPGGTPLYAMGSGTIIQEGIGGFGPNAPVLQITSGPLVGKTVYYGHSGPDLVPVGAQVVQGQQISSVGSGIVGISTGPHLEIGF